MSYTTACIVQFLLFAWVVYAFMVAQNEKEKYFYFAVGLMHLGLISCGILIMLGT